MDASAAMAPAGSRGEKHCTKGAADPPPGISRHTAIVPWRNAGRDAANLAPLDRGSWEEGTPSTRRPRAGPTQSAETMWSKLALVGTAAAFVGPRPTRLAPLANNPLDKLGLEKPEDVAKLVQEKVGDLDLDSAKAFGSKNLDVLKDNQERALIDVAAAAFCGLLFAGVYGAVVFALGWFAAAPSTDAYSRPADSYGACIETALPGAAVGALVGLLLPSRSFPSRRTPSPCSSPWSSSRARARASCAWTEATPPLRSAVRERRVLKWPI